MIVDPELTNHPKFRRLERRVGEGAAKVLLRLWGHCQGNKRGEFWPGKTAGYVEDIAGWNGAAGELARALAECYEGGSGWIEISDKGVRIHGWEEMNRGLKANWTRNPAGVSKGKATGTPRGSHGPPLGEPDRLDGEEGVEGLRAREGATQGNPGEKGRGPSGLPPGPNADDAHIPSLAEVVALGQMPGVGVPADYCEHFWERHDEGSASWLNAQGELKDVGKRLRSWWVKDRGAWDKKRAGKKGGNREAVAELEARLQVESDPGRVEAIRKQLEVSR